jgi:molybdopterin-guanine dinucleotide biosynthesis protein A
MTLEAVVLTGGGSRRMGRDKAMLEIDGVPQAERIVRQFLAADIPVTVLGREPIGGAAFIKDREDFGGPIAALSAFRPNAEAVFVVSCDLPRFDLKLFKYLEEAIGEHQACAPEVDGFHQPLSALYRKESFASLSKLEDQCAMGWLHALDAKIVHETELREAGIDPASARGANTPSELAAALSEVPR